MRVFLRDCTRKPGTHFCPLFSPLDYFVLCASFFDFHGRDLFRLCEFSGRVCNRIDVDAPSHVIQTV